MKNWKCNIGFLHITISYQDEKAAKKRISKRDFLCPPHTTATFIINKCDFLILEILQNHFRPKICRFLFSPPLCSIQQRTKICRFGGFLCRFYDHMHGCAWLPQYTIIVLTIEQRPNICCQCQRLWKRQQFCLKTPKDD
jgi:hypothetical protein